MKNITLSLHPASALVGAAALTLVFFATSAAQSGATGLGGFNGPVRQIEITNGALNRKPIRIDYVHVDAGGGTPFTELAYTVPIGKTLLLDGESGHGDGVYLTRVAVPGGNPNATAEFAWNQHFNGTRPAVPCGRTIDRAARLRGQLLECTAPHAHGVSVATSELGVLATRMSTSSR